MTERTATPPIAVSESERSNVRSRQAVLAFYALGIGLFGGVLAVLPVYMPGAGRYDFPKAVVVQLAALVAAVVCAFRATRVRIEPVDLVLMAFLAWSAVSAAGATNRWWAASALELTVASLAVFWTARCCARSGFTAQLGAVISVAVVLAALIAVLEAYGLVRSLSVEFGAPGGTLGIRNRMAHLLALGLPVFLVVALTVRRRIPLLLMTAGLVLITMAMVLSRTRAAWLAAVAMTVVMIGSAMMAPSLKLGGIPRKRLAFLAGAAVIGILAAVYLPNRLVWHSDSPYRETLQRVADYQSGSGRGRILQYRNTLEMVRDHPLLGVGPGNWPIWYPRYAPPGDPTYHPERIAPVYSFPHGDWLGTAAERGLPSLMLSIVAGCMLFGGAWYVIRRGGKADLTFWALALQGTIVVSVVIGLVDPLLFTPVGAFLLFLILGTLATQQPPVITVSLGTRGRLLWVATVLVILFAAAADRSRQVGAAMLYALRYPPVSRLAQATRLYPGDYYAHMLLARQLADQGDCGRAEPHITAGRRLYPAALEPGRIQAVCTNPPSTPDAPEVLSSNVIFAKRCDRIVYSSNRDDHVSPFVIAGAGAGADPKIVPLDIRADLDLLAKSLSADCKTAALVGDEGGNGIYDVFLYDFTNKSLSNLTASPNRNDGEAEFAPAKPLLAYLADGALLLYDVPSHRGIAVPDSPTEFTTLTWSSDGGRVFLEDRRTNIWQYDVAQQSFDVSWVAPKVSYSPRMMYHRGQRPFGDFLYFISDHESDVTQIYRLDLASLALTRVHPSTHDQYSPQIDRDRNLVFRTNIDGNFVAQRLRNGHTETISPTRGVVYDVSLDFSAPLFVYAGDRAILSIYAAEHGDSTKLKSLVPMSSVVTQPDAQELRSADSMMHVVYVPTGAPKGWVVWLHGGPNEQVSPRFNLYFDFLVRLGYGVVAINYPGSTGLGNRYELRGVPDSIEIRQQLAGIDEVLAQVAKSYPGFERYVLVGVSYGSTLGYLHIRHHPGHVTKFIDFSGATEDALRRNGTADCAGVRSLLLIQGANDRHQRSPARRALLSACGRVAVTRRVVLPDEGHFVRRRSSIRRILGEIERFLALP